MIGVRVEEAEHFYEEVFAAFDMVSSPGRELASSQRSLSPPGHEDARLLNPGLL